MSRNYMSPQKVLSLSSRVLAFGLLFVVSVATGDDVAAGKHREAMDFQYVPQSAVAVVAFRPNAILKSQLGKPLMKFVEEKFAKNFLPGIRLTDMDQLTVAFLPPAKGRYKAVVICRSTKKRDWIGQCQKSPNVKIHKKRLDEKRSYYYVSVGKKHGNEHICQIDEHTLIFGDEVNMLMAALSAAASSPSFFGDEEWKQAGFSDVAVSANVSDPVTAYWKQLNSLPIELDSRVADSAKSLVDVLQKVEYMTASLNVRDTNIESDLSLKFQDSANAKSGRETLNALRVIGINQLATVQEFYRNHFRERMPQRIKTQIVVMGLYADILKGLSLEVSNDIVKTSKTITPPPELIQSWAKLQTEDAYVKQSRNNMRQIMLGLHNFHDTYLTFPPASSQWPTNKARHSWRVTVLPFVGESGLYQKYNFDEPWDSPQNKQLLSQMPEVFASPGVDKSKGMTKYLAVAGTETVLTSDRPTGDNGYKGSRIRDITDGTSNTIMFVEANKSVPWTKPEDLPFDAEKPIGELIKHLPNRFLAAAADGVVHQVVMSETEEFKTILKRAFIRSDGEVAYFEKLTRPQTQRQPTRRPASKSVKLTPETRLKQVGLALHNFHDRQLAFPPASAQKPNTKARHSWRVAILPNLKRKDLYDQYNFDEPWDSPQNKKLLSQMPDVFAAGDDKDAQGLTPLLAIVGPDTVISSVQRTGGRGYIGASIAQIIDGTSQTIMVMESKQRVPWTKPEDIPFEKSKPFDFQKWINPVGYNVLTADGRVTPMKLTNSDNSHHVDALRSMFTRNGKEVVKFK